MLADLGKKEKPLKPPVVLPAGATYTKSGKIKMPSKKELQAMQAMEQMEAEKRSKAYGWWIIGILAVAIIAGGAYFLTRDIGYDEDEE